MTWFRALARPQVVVAALLVVAAFGLLLRPSGPGRSRPPQVDLDGTAGAAVVENEVRLLLIDRDGLELPRFVRLRYPDRAEARLEAVVTALRAELVAAGVWPADAAVPTLYHGVLGVRSFVVLDFGAGFDGLSVAQERQLIGSLGATLAVEGIDEVRYLREGRPRPAPFGHLALPTGL